MSEISGQMSFDDIRYTLEEVAEEFGVDLEEDGERFQAMEDDLAEVDRINAIYGPALEALEADDGQATNP